MKRIITLIALMMVVTGCEAINDFLASSDPVASNEPPALTLDLADPITMDLGSYCWSNDGMGLCADAISPSYTEENAIALSDNTLTLTFADSPPTSISAYVHPGTNLMTRIADIQVESSLEGNTVTLTLPDRVDGTYVLVITAQWLGDTEGDAFYSLPISVGR